MFALRKGEAVKEKIMSRLVESEGLLISLRRLTHASDNLKSARRFLNKASRLAVVTKEIEIVARKRVLLAVEGKPLRPWEKLAQAEHQKKP